MSGVQLSERHLHPEQRQRTNVLLFQEKDGFKLDRDIVSYWFGFGHIPIIFVLGLFDFF